MNSKSNDVPFLVSINYSLDQAPSLSLLEEGMRMLKVELAFLSLQESLSFDYTFERLEES